MKRLFSVISLFVVTLFSLTGAVAMPEGTKTKAKKVTFSEPIEIPKNKKIQDVVRKSNTGLKSILRVDSNIASGAVAMEQECKSVFFQPKIMHILKSEKVENNFYKISYKEGTITDSKVCINHTEIQLDTNDLRKGQFLDDEIEPGYYLVLGESGQNQSKEMYKRIDMKSAIDPQVSSLAKLLQELGYTYWGQNLNSNLFKIEDSTSSSNLRIHLISQRIAIRDCNNDQIRSNNNDQIRSNNDDQIRSNNDDQIRSNNNDQIRSKSYRKIFGVTVLVALGFFAWYNKNVISKWFGGAAVSTFKNFFSTHVKPPVTNFSLSKWFTTKK